MRHWLMKSEPGSYSIDDLARDRRTPWDGVRNPIARNHMKEMKKGDQVLFYHSSTNPTGVAGVAKVVSKAYPDPTQFDPKSRYHDKKSTPGQPRWWLVDIAFVRKLERVVCLREIKSEPSLEDMVLVRNSRLSVQPVTEAEYRRVLEMEG